jgi:uncharacterized cupredoxin-like copper-binding protein
MGRVTSGAAILMAGGLVLSACGADSADGNAAAAASDDGIVVSMGEFAYSPSEIAAEAGTTFTITLVNDGVVTHEFMLGRDNRDDGGYIEDLLGEALEDATGTGFMTSAMMAEEAEDADHDEGEAEDADHDEGEAEEAEDADHDEGEAEDADHDEGEAEEAEEGGHGHDGNTIMVEPGGQVELTLTLPADAEGVWEMGCFIEGHYEAGMLGQLVVA